MSMARPFDTATKHLLDRFAADCLPLVTGLPPRATAEPTDADLATVQLAADRVFRLRRPLGPSGPRACRTRRELLYCRQLLCRLRYTKAAFARSRGMKDSIVYQATIQEGRAHSLVEDRRQAVLDLLTGRFGTVPPEVEARVRAVADLDQLRAALRRAIRVADPNDLEL